MLLGVLGTALWLFLPFWEIAGQFGSHPLQQPSRLYARPEVIEPGQALDLDGLIEKLRAAGYRQTESSPTPGTFRTVEDRVELHRRLFPSPRGLVGSDFLQITVRGGRIASLKRGDKELAGIWLDPALVASFYGPELQERRPVDLDQVPEDLILSVLAAEDAGFLGHAGLSIKGILRAAWTNFQANAVRQGGSTLTQQLVKNLYLSHERRFVRKVREALLAVLLEMRYDKRSILQAYLNEIYWGRSGRIDLMGIGAAAWAYFGKPPAELSLGEAALLAGMIRAPANLSPVDNPDAASQRRDEILGRLAELEWITPERLAAASREPIKAVSQPLVARRAPYFADFMAEELARRFDPVELEDKGYTLHSTLDLSDQEAAEESVGWGIEALETGWEKDRKTQELLQAALISLDPRDGSILAYVGGRDYSKSQFDRVTNAHRQAGSAFKPIVFAAAFERRVASPATFLDDSPYTVYLPDRTWSPRNSDGEFHGWVSARTALEKSYNVPTARLAVDMMGMDPVVDMARRLGIGRNLRPLPALALGAMEVTPLELATVYSTLASGGLRTTPHGLVAVYDRQGRELTPKVALPAPERSLSADVAFLVTQVLRGVIDRGTANRVRRDGLSDPVAGKTGTTNDRRDSWFAGYSPDRATLIWVGYDDNTKTRLSGARAAVPIWARFTWKVRPPNGYPDFTVPEGVVLGWIDPRTGGLAHEDCTERQPEYFLRDFVPEPACADDRLWRRRFDDERRPGRLRRWIDALRGREDDDERRRRRRGGGSGGG